MAEVTKDTAFDPDHLVWTIERDQEKIQKAELARQKELAGRRSLWTRFVGALIETKSATALREAQEKLKRTQTKAAKATRNWIEDTVEAQVSKGAKGADQVRAREQAVEHTHARHTHLRELSNMGQETLNALTQAASSCSSASSMEMMDMVSSNKAISFMSTAQTSSAGEDVRRAQRQLEAFGNAVSSSGLSDELKDAPDDLLDLTVDFALDLSFDFLSLMNMSALNESESSCHEAYEQVYPVAMRLSSMDEKAEQAWTKARQALEQARAPFIAEATAKLPAPLQALLAQQTEDDEAELIDAAGALF